MNRLYILTFLAISALGPSAAAQDEDARLNERVYSRKYTTSRDSTKNEIPKGNIRVVEDARITKLDGLKKKYPGQMDGYRVQIFFGDRGEALETKAKFLAEHPEIPAYISYLAPNFRLRVGDFRTKIEGEKLKQEIESVYQGSYLVKDKIELPSLDIEEETESYGKEPGRY